MSNLKQKSVLKGSAWFFTLIMVIFLSGGLIVLFLLPHPPIPGKRLPRTPVKLDDKTGRKVGALLKNAGWVSPGLHGNKLYFVGFRSCPDCLAYKKSEFGFLHNHQIDTRIILYARRARSCSAERYMAAKLAQDRKWSDYKSWFAIPYTSHCHKPENKALTLTKSMAPYLEKNRALRDRLAKILYEKGWNMEVPALFWKKNRNWYFYLGDNTKSYAAIRKSLLEKPTSY